MYQSLCSQVFYASKHFGLKYFLGIAPSGRRWTDILIHFVYVPESAHHHLSRSIKACFLVTSNKIVNKFCIFIPLYQSLALDYRSRSESYLKLDLPFTF